jgi:hypothetical protein
VDNLSCRACRGMSGDLVLDLGEQPASDYFPARDAPGPDPVYPLQMWLCSSCGLAQLAADPTVPEEPKGIEPAALAAQAASAVLQAAAAGVLPAAGLVAEYGSPHGGSWLGLLADRGLMPAGTGAADVVLDCFGLMHAADQALALAERATRVVKGGVLLLQYHSLDAIIRHGQWNSLRHGHYAYYSTTAITAMLAQVGFSPRTAWQFDLYGGTILLAARRDTDEPGAPDSSVRTILSAEARTGVRDANVLRELQDDARAHAGSVHEWLGTAKAAGRSVFGYGAASRAVALLRLANVDHELLSAVADASPAKQGTRMPGTRIPVISPAELVDQRPGEVLVFVADLLHEVRNAYPEIAQYGGRWLAADSLTPHEAGDRRLGAGFGE